MPLLQTPLRSTRILQVVRLIRALSSSAQASLGHTSLAPAIGRPLRMVMFGKPGAGKGTLSGRLISKYDISFISTGDLLRQHVEGRTEIGRIAADIMASGGLVSDEIMLQVLSSKLDELRGKNWIIDGFPRTLGQGELLDSLLKKTGSPLSLVVNLDVPDEVILSRITDRWTHLPSGRVYNLSYNRPIVEGRDDVTGEVLSKRPDDNPEIFSRRLEAFYKSTSPLLQYYSARAARSAPPPPPTPSSTSKSLLHVSRIDSTYSDKTRPHVISLSGRTSDEIWPQLDAAVQHRFGVRARKVHPLVGQVAVTSVPKVEGARQAIHMDIRSGSPA